MSTTNRPTVSLSLTTRDSAAALEFYVRAFGAEEIFRLPDPQGGVAHAEFRIGNTHIFISDEAEDWHAKALPDGILAPCLFTIGTDDCDAAFRKAVEAGADPLSEPVDQFWGERSAMVKDPFGYRWGIAQHVEDVSPEELERRVKELFGS